MIVIDEENTHVCMHVDEKTGICHVSVNGRFSELAALMYALMDRIDMGYEVLKVAISKYEKDMKDDKKR